MKIKNGTRYDTRELRSIFCAVHNRVAKDEGRLPQWKRLEVEVVYSRSVSRVRCHKDEAGEVTVEHYQTDHSTGYAYINGYYTRLRLPKGKVGRDSVAFVFAHELMHLYGYHHNQFIDRLAWREGIDGTIYENAPKETPKRDIQMERYERLLTRQQEWEKKARRAQAALKKIRPKVRYYERTLKAAGKIDGMNADKEDHDVTSTDHS